MEIPAKVKTAEAAQKANPASLEELLSACREGDTIRIRKLLKNQPNDNTSENPLNRMLDGQTPLMAATGHGQLDAVRLLINRGADPHQQGQEGETPLSKAAQGGHLTVISDLIAHGSPVSLQDIQALLAHIQLQEPPTLVSQGMSRLSRAAATDNVEEIRRRVGKHFRRDGAEKLNQWLNTPDKQGLTPLMQAAKHGKLNAIRILLDSGADISKQDAKGATALTQAARHKQTEAIRLLLDCEAKATPEDVRLLLDEPDSDSGSETYYSAPVSPRSESPERMEESPKRHASPSFDQESSSESSNPFFRSSSRSSTEYAYKTTFEDYSWENPWQTR